MVRDSTWLEESLKAVDRVFFSDSLAHAGWTIGWDRWRRTKTFVYGRCYYSKSHIVINPVLKAEWVPEHVVLYTIYHEAIHATGVSDHSAEFQSQEWRFPHAVIAEGWCRENIDTLIEAQRTP